MVRQGKRTALPYHFAKIWNVYRATPKSHQSELMFTRMMAFQRQFRIMKLFKAIFLNSNLGLLFRVIQTEMGVSGLSIIASDAKKNN